MKTLGITGAGGWIGGRLREAAAARGIAVRAIPREALASVDACARAIDGCDTVVHLAAIVHRDSGAIAEHEYLEVNAECTRRLALAGARASIGRLVFVSTAKVAGDRTTRPARETDAPAPADGYSRSKLLAERVLGEADPRWPFSIAIARPPLVYGPGVRANFLALLRIADTPWPLPLGGARALRSLVYVDNLVDALIFLGQAPLDGTRTFFVADDRDTCVASLLRSMRERLRRRAPVFTLPMPLMTAGLRAAGMLGHDLAPAFSRLFDPLQVDSRALRDAGWRAPVAPDAALDDTVRWYRSR